MKLFHEANKKLSFCRRKSLNFPLHLHQAAELAVVTKGKTHALCNGKSFPLEEGDLFLAFPNQIHGFENDEDLEAAMLIVPIYPYLDSFRTVLEQQAPAASVLKKGTWEGRGVGEFFRRALEEWPSLCEEEKKGYLLLIFSRLLPLFPCEPRNPVDSTAAEAALRYLSEHFTEPLNRRDLSRALNYTESYLSHLFS